MSLRPLHERSDTLETGASEGATMIEALIVVAVMTVLTAALLPGVDKAATRAHAALDRLQRISAFIAAESALRREVARVRYPLWAMPNAALIRRGPAGDERAADSETLPSDTVSELQSAVLSLPYVDGVRSRELILKLSDFVLLVSIDESGSERSRAVYKMEQGTRLGTVQRSGVALGVWLRDPAVSAEVRVPFGAAGAGAVASNTFGTETTSASARIETPGTQAAADPR